MENIIREADLADCPRLARLSGQLGYPSTVAQIGRRLERIRQAGPVNQVLVAEAAGEVVGWVYLFGNLHLESDPFAEIGGLVVDEEWRGRGIGEQLVEAAVHWARQQGYDCLQVRSNVIREQAHRFYQRLGFDLRKTQAVFARRL